MVMRFKRFVGETYEIKDSDGNVISTHTIALCQGGITGKYRVQVEVDAPGLRIERRQGGLDKRITPSQP